MNEKHGLCIGGPVAGQRRSSPSKIMKVPFVRAVSLVGYGSFHGPQDELETDVHVYKHFEMGADDGDERSKLGFWVEANDQRPFHTVMSALLRCYAANAKDKPE